MPGKDGCHQMPEKSGTACPPPAAWPSPGIAAIAATAETAVTMKTDFHRCMRTPVPCPQTLKSAYAKAVNADSRELDRSIKVEGKTVV